MRQFQGASLFGLERFGEPPQTERRHGYGIGRIDFNAGEASIKFWPRKAVFDSSNGWRLTPDHEKHVLHEPDSCTSADRLGGRDKRASKREDQVDKEPQQPARVDDDTNQCPQNLREMELQLKHALEAFKGQSPVFIEPKISKKREFNNEPNQLDSIIESPRDALIIAPSGFGLTCLGLYLQLEAYKKRIFWLYIDAEKTKGRKISDLIEEQLLHYQQQRADLKCLILDSWDAGVLDHQTMIRVITTEYPNIPLIVLAEDSVVPDVSGNLAKLKRNFEVLHLQALSRNAMRKLVAGYNETKHIGTEDVILASLANHLESINIHRTPLNCYTLLRVLDSGHNEKLLNKSKLLRAILFILFTDHDSFSHLSEKPEIDECAYVLGCFCRDLIKQGTREFDSTSFSSKLSEICKSRYIIVDIDAMLDVLLENNILVRSGNQIYFRHRYWIFYFAAEWMRHDDEFRLHILQNRNYVNFPEIIEFYTGIDGKRSDAIESILNDLNLLIDEVDNKIGIERSFDPLSTLQWCPSDEYIQQARSQIAERVESSNLPADIKDKHADGHYHSSAPYDQSIRTFLTDYSVLSLLNSIKAASSALRSSPFIDAELKHKVTNAIFRGWEEISRVVFWLSPILAKDGSAIHDGFALRLDDGFSTDLDQRFKQIITSNPLNIARILGGDLASKKIVPLLEECSRATSSKIQKHMIALFIATVRPIGWYDAILRYINLLHPRSFYFGDIFAKLTSEIQLGDLESGEEPQLKRLTQAIINKQEYAPKTSGDKEIPPGKLISDDNRLPIDKLLKGNHKHWPSS